MLNAKHVSRSGSLLGRAFLQQPTVTLVGAGFSKTPCCLPNFSMICVSLTWQDWRGELSSSAECKWLKIRTATWQAANRFRRRLTSYSPCCADAAHHSVAPLLHCDTRNGFCC